MVGQLAKRFAKREEAKEGEEEAKETGKIALFRTSRMELMGWMTRDCGGYRQACAQTGSGDERA